MNVQVSNREKEFVRHAVVITLFILIVYVLFIIIISPIWLYSSLFANEPLNALILKCSLLKNSFPVYESLTIKLCFITILQENIKKKRNRDKDEK